MTIQQNPLVDAAELARILGVTPEQVLRLGRQGRIPRVVVGRRTVRFDVDQVLVALAAPVAAPQEPSLPAQRRRGAPARSGQADRVQAPLPRFDWNAVQD